MATNLVRACIPLDLIDPNEHNPNELSKRQFNLLVDNIDKMGLTDPILVRKVGNRYRVVGGHHRLKAVKLLGHLSAQCTVIDDASFDDDQERFQLMRHNLIRGRVSPTKFVALYESMSAKYTKDVLAESFGFEEQAQLERLVKQTAKDLPAELKKPFQDGVKTVKSIKGLGTLLNTLFTTYGDTLPFGYMFFDFGGKESVWIRLHGSDMVNLKSLADKCRANSVAIDGVFRVMLQLSAQGKLPWLDTTIGSLPKVKVPVSVVPTEELMANAGV